MNYMNYKIAILSALCTFTFLCAQEDKKKKQPKFINVDKILATIYHPEETAIITQSDLRPGLDGVPRALNEVIFDKLIYLDAKRLKLHEISDDEVERLLASIQKQHDLTKEGLTEAFKQSGFTLEQGREELKKREIRDRMIHFRIKDKILMEKADIVDYYEKNPTLEPGSLKISQGFIPWSAESKKDAKAKTNQSNIIEKTINSKDILHTIEWNTPFDIQEDELPEDRMDLKDMAADSIVKFKETDDGLTLLHIVSKKPGRTVPLEEQEQEISMKLRAEKYMNALKDYEKNLLDPVKKAGLIKYHDQKTIDKTQ